MLWYRYILFDWDKSLFGFRHTRRNRRLQFYASYMNVFTPHPTPPQPTPSPRMTHAWQVQENLH